MDLSGIIAEIENCNRCALRSGCKNAVPGDLDEHLDILFVGEAPGEEEDAMKRPFVGRSGQLLRCLLGYVNSARIGITNAVKCRPPMNRMPLRNEIQACHVLTTKIIAACEPKVIVCVGRVAYDVFAAENKKSTRAPFSKVVGSNFYSEKYNATIYTILHPAYILRNRSKKSELEAQIKYLSKALPSWIERSKHARKTDK